MLITEIIFKIVLNNFRSLKNSVTIKYSQNYFSDSLVRRIQYTYSI